MISSGAFQSSFDSSIQFLKKFNIFKSRGVRELGKVSKTFLEDSKCNDHLSIHKHAIQNSDYDILLFDDSFFQFERDENIIRYCFVSNPTIFYSKEQYNINIFGEDEWLNLTQTERDELSALTDEEGYEQFLNEQKINTESKIIRFDANEKGYNPLCHSFSHIHVGNKSDFRIPCSKILTPLSFVMFCTKLMFYSKWEDKIIEHEELLQLAKNGCNTVPPKHWNSAEELQLFLS